jgi:uncharacterized protein (DUF2236 family)
MRTLADIAPEGILLAGAGRAILLQIAYPEIGYGVARHSDFAARPMDRLNATLSYVYALSNGTEHDLALVRRAVNRAHVPVRTARDGDPEYDARDPQLQLWVAATLYDTAIVLYERIFGTLDDDAAEHVHREYARLGTELQMPEALWPATRADFRVYWDEMLPRLRVDRTVRRVSDALLQAENAPTAIRVAMPLARFVTAGLLPEPLRAPFGFSWNARRQRRFDRLIGAVAPVYRVVPAGIRRWPARHYLARIPRVYG